MRTRTMTTRRFSSLLAALTLLGASIVGACGGGNVPSDTTSTTSATTTSSTSTSGGTGGHGGAGTGGAPGTGGSAGAGGAGGAPDCFMNPMTHVEIINACTDADALDKNPDLPLLGADGSLPPLP